MSRHLYRWLGTTLAILMIPHLISGVRVDNFGTALAVAAVLGLLNVFVRPLLILITLPLTVLSFGLFILILNGLLFKIAGSFVEGFSVESFSSAFLASLVVSLVSWFLNLKVKRSTPATTGVIDLDRGKDGHWH